MNFALIPNNLLKEEIISLVEQSIKNLPENKANKIKTDIAYTFKYQMK